MAETDALLHQRSAAIPLQSPNNCSATCKHLENLLRYFSFSFFHCISIFVVRVKNCYILNRFVNYTRNNNKKCLLFIYKYAYLVTVSVLKTVNYVKKRKKITVSILPRILKH
ncbi:uncharacterized protein LOC127279040 [Leptopilina boulardi]|uniref:uncharacterized protein LOC127279040 n=1 Tax=Leptopilina boulardi TaxID=63433 RepID=UPI0021F5D506|nr:uncharacterized protein LOC127279040 [Leptopilina boulardi]